MAKACLEWLECQNEQGGERKKKAHFLCERERACMDSLHGDGGLGVAQRVAKVKYYLHLEAWLEW